MTNKERCVVTTFCNQKGGQGKTSAVTCFAYGLSHRGYKVLIVDFDGQATLTSNFTDFLDEDERLLPDITKVYEKDIYEWLIDGEDVRVSVHDGIDLIPATLDGVRSLERDMAQDYLAPSAFLEKALDPIRDQYDFILIDTSSNINLPLTNALTASNAVVIPAEPRSEGLIGFERVWSVIESVKRVNPYLASVGVFIHAFKEQPKGHKSLAQEIMAAAQERNCEMYQTRIHENEPMADALGSHEDPFKHKRRIRAAREYESLIDEFLERVKRNG